MAHPPRGTKPGTLHTLKNDSATDRFEWTGKSWSTPGTGYGTKPGYMAALGWRYVGPVTASPSAAQPAATTVPGRRMVPIDPNVHMIGALSEYTDEPIEAWYAALAHVVHSQPDREA
ncbi:MAG: hypothetical protein ACLGJC_05175, partial [Alphaproteobacteria bacterium]